MHPITSPAMPCAGDTIFSPAGEQRRLRGRALVAPSLDLSKVVMRAVVDRVALEVRVPRPTQFRHLQKLIADNIHYMAFVKAVDPLEGGSARQFEVTLQDPDRGRLLGLVAAIQNKHEGDCTVTATMVEVALDARPRPGSGLSLEELVQHVRQHFLPSPEIISKFGGRPRQAYSRRAGTVRILGHKGGYEPAIDGRGTIYFGQDGAPVTWRLYRKVQDSVRDGVGRPLPPCEQAVRLEVTLRGAALTQLGLTSVESLVAFRFQRLKRCFRFFLPTLPRSDGAGELSVSASAEAWRSRYHQRLAKECGVWAVLEVDAASVEHRRRLRAKLHREAQPRLRPLTANGYLKAYDEMNERVRDALRRCRL